MPGPPLTLDELRRFAVARSLFGPTTLRRALARMGFVQADPIRAPARAQDLILRQRVKARKTTSASRAVGYRAGDLERQYESLGVEEDFFVNYGYVTREVQALMHPRSTTGNQTSVARERKREQLLLDFVEERGAVHPREVEAHFARGRVRNYWGGSSHATTQMLEELHYRGKLRVVRREKGIRVYRTHRHESALLDEAARQRRIDALVDVAVKIYAPLPAASLSYYVRRLRYAVPQWEDEISGALQRARERLAHARVEGVDWYWPDGENPREAIAPEAVRLLAPFDPVVHDRARFELLWGWVYRFEAYTPAPKRKLGYYALPLLWRDRVIGWGNLAVTVPKSNLGTRGVETRGLGKRTLNLTSDLGYVGGKPPPERAFKRELEAELERMRFFLGATGESGERRRSS
ncbi:MAG TPA: crosslink repair DNA glycosylase YcaQ family protein [Chthoniobacterales bacterium]|nr:crosslink repair DNA glycosylase YcaQ family protein [Chthoniobacterales bacterium]